MKLAHALCNLLRCLRLAQGCGSQGCSVEELFEPTIGERPEESRSDLLPREALQDAELVVSIDQMLHLRAVDPQQYLGRLLLRHFRRLEVFRRSYNVDCICQSTAQPLNLNLFARVQCNPSPAFQSQGMGKTNDFILEGNPGQPFLLFPPA